MRSRRAPDTQVLEPGFRDLRSRLVQAALTWKATFVVAPRVIPAIAELDAARLVGMSLRDYLRCVVGPTAVGRGHDFIHSGRKHRVKANRPSGRPGSCPAQ